MTQHTPGPWMLHDMEFATVVTEKKPGQFVALCDSHKLTHETSKANARLIASAPDLLNALRLYVKLDDDNRAGCKITDEDWSECWNTAAVAINHATK